MRDNFINLDLLEGHTGVVHCFQIWETPSQEFLFSSSHDGELIIWNINPTLREIMNPEIKDVALKKLKMESQNRIFLIILFFQEPQSCIDIR